MRRDQQSADLFPDHPPITRRGDSIVPPTRREVAKVLGNFERPAPFQKHSITSISAGESIEPKAGTLRAIVLGFLRGRGDLGATDEEMQDGAGIGASTQRPRRVELVERGLVVDSEGKRPTRSGRQAVVWKAVTP